MTGAGALAGVPGVAGACGASGVRGVGGRGAPARFKRAPGLATGDRDAAPPPLRRSAPRAASRSAIVSGRATAKASAAGKNGELGESLSCQSLLQPATAGGTRLGLARGAGASAAASASGVGGAKRSGGGGSGAGGGSSDSTSGCASSGAAGSAAAAGASTAGVSSTQRSVSVSVTDARALLMVVALLWVWPPRRLAARRCVTRRWRRLMSSGAERERRWRGG